MSQLGLRCLLLKQYFFFFTEYKTCVTNSDCGNDEKTACAQGFCYCVNVLTKLTVDGDCEDGMYTCLWLDYHTIVACLSLWVRISHRQRGVLDTTLCDKVCQWLATGWWFSPGTPVSSTNKTDRHNITEILLKVALGTINQPINQRWNSSYGGVRSFSILQIPFYGFLVGK